MILPIHLPPAAMPRNDVVAPGPRPRPAGSSTDCNDGKGGQDHRRRAARRAEDDAAAPARAAADPAPRPPAPLSVLRVRIEAAFQEQSRRARQSA